MRGMFLALLLVGLLGCAQRDFKDPLIRQQLTGLLAALPEAPDQNVYRARDELHALLEVHSARLSPRQELCLQAAWTEAHHVALHVERFRESPQGDGPTGVTEDESQRQFDPAYQPPTYAEHLRAYGTVKARLAEAAGMF